MMTFGTSAPSALLLSSGWPKTVGINASDAMLLCRTSLEDSPIFAVCTDYVDAEWLVKKCVLDMAVNNVIRRFIYLNCIETVSRLL